MEINALIDPIHLCNCIDSIVLYSLFTCKFVKCESLMFDGGKYFFNIK